MKTTILALPLLLTPLACTVAAPTVTDFNGASVKMRTDIFTAYPNAATQSEANRICGMDGGKRGEYASTAPVPNVGYEHLYLCL